MGSISMQGNYAVQIESYAERHFIKSFRKKYKSHWDITLLAIIAELERIDALLLTNRAEIIIGTDEVKIIKTKFKIARSNESATSSGNRCIVAWYPTKRRVSVLLVYGKTDIGDGNETAVWKRLIKDNYPELQDIL
ncbi:MAG: hypothetical protein HYZ63_01750 [Candidatus Andersenbacteria bacterium]|nr:hypothetical protein [Candidatus Andersenbacteria bacterium]